MAGILGFQSFGNMLSNVFGNNWTDRLGRWQSNSTNETVASEAGGSEFSINLKFHAVHGEAIQLLDNCKVAKRDAGRFEHSLVFSHRPVGVDEVITIEILETTHNFNGPLRIGFTSINPTTLINEGRIPAGRDFKTRDGVWLKGVHMHRMSVGMLISYRLSFDGTVLYSINGEDKGVFLQGVNTAQPLWTVLEAYGIVEAIKFTNLGIDVTDGSQNENIPLELDDQVATGRVTRSSARLAVRTTTNSTSLSTRRNVRVSPLATKTASSPKSPAFFSPNPISTISSPSSRQGPCIICTERESNAAFVKCGHICMCYECALDFKKRATVKSPESGTNRRARPICPICRNPIISVLKIYMQ